MFWQALFVDGTGARICLTLVHSLWVVALAALVASAVGRLWLRTRVQWCYLVHVGALVVGLAALPVVFLLLRVEGAERGSVVVSPRTDAVGQVSLAAAGGEVIAAPDVPALDRGMVREGSGFVLVRKDEVVAKRPHEWRWLAPWIVGVYVAGVMVMLVRLFAGVVAVERLRGGARPVVDAAMREMLGRLAAQWRLRCAPMVAMAEGIAVPTVVGLLRPMILLPASVLTGLSAGELELIVAHELAHVRRYDLWVNLLQRAAEVVLFFNPALWYLSRQISTLREYCCDELVCRNAGPGPAPVRSEYALALVRVVELARPGVAAQAGLLTLAASSGSPSELRRRVARLVGEPLCEPVRLSRGGMLVIGLAGAAILVAAGWLHAEGKDRDAKAGDEAKAEAKADATAEVAANYPPPEPEADRAVAAARKRTFGLQGVPRMSLQQSSWNGAVRSMKSVREASFKKLFEARGEDVDEKMRDATTSMSTLAWDGNKLLLGSVTDVPAERGSPAFKYMQSRYWDGQAGWLGETSSERRTVYRYPTVDKMFDHCFEGLNWPQLIAGGGHVPWNGPAIELDEYQVDAKWTRYERKGSETIDGAVCEIYEGPARMERLWIEKATGLVKAASRSFSHEEMPKYYSEAIREVAGRTFLDGAEYGAWIESQPADVQAKLSAHWAAAAWRGSKPANLSVFSDYREIVPGVHWPMRCEHTEVLPVGNGRTGKYEYFRSELKTTNATQEFSIEELAKNSLPDEGVKVVDRRYDPEIDYVWSRSIRDEDLRAKAEGKLKLKQDKEAEERRINETPINSVADAMEILTEGPKTDPTKAWARAVKYLADHKEEAFPVVVKQLDGETRDHVIRKLAFTLRAMGDPRGVPALVRALPRTLLPGASDYGLVLEDSPLLWFMQKNDQEGEVRKGSNGFNYGRAFREVVSALRRLSGQKFDEMELNGVFLAETPAQQEQQRVLFHRVAERWAAWWEANWKTLTPDEAYAKVSLPALAPGGPKFVGREKPPVGKGVKLLGGWAGWIVQAAEDSKQRCFVDLDTMREGAWPAELGPVEQVGVDSPEVLAWARREGYDMVGVRYTPPGETTPIYALKPLDMHTWKLTNDELRQLPSAMAGKNPYPLSQPVERMVPRRKVEPPYDIFSGDAFLFVTREGTAGVIRMTAQVTEVRDSVERYVAVAADDEFQPTGFYRGAKIHIQPMTEAK